MTDNSCPLDEELWPATVGEDIPRALREHLATCLTCQVRIHALQSTIEQVRGVRLDLPDVSIATTEEQALPLSIGGYTVVSKLAAGGQADVYRACHPRLKIDVVLKWYRTTSIDHAELARIVAEAQMLGSIRHPCLCQVFDVGVDHGRYFLVMEYVSGLTFSDWIRRARPTSGRVAAVLAQVARAVDFVHQRGVLHLDIKPGNILISDNGHPTIIDFSMARTHGFRADISRMAAPGTPEYMAPEQYAGHPDELSYATDIYGLGAVLYAALSQRPVRTTEQMNLHPDWTLVSTAPLGLQRICRKALAFHPGHRHDSAVTVARQLESFADRRRTSHRFGAILATLLAIVSLGVVLQDWWNRPEPVSFSITAETAFQSHGRSVSSTECRAHSFGSQAPTLLVATATTDAFEVPYLRSYQDGDEVIAEPCMAVGEIRVADNAGPILILSTRLPTVDTPCRLVVRQLLKRYLEVKFSGPLCFRIDEQQVERVPCGADDNPQNGMTSDERIAAALTQNLQMELTRQLSQFQGILKIPASRCELVAATTPHGSGEGPTSSGCSVD